MPKPRSARLETATARLKLPARPRPYAGPAIGHATHLYYRRTGNGNGKWVLKIPCGDGRYSERRIAAADDYEKSNRASVLSYYEAVGVARQIANGDTTDAPADASADAPGDRIM